MIKQQRKQMILRKSYMLKCDEESRKKILLFHIFLMDTGILLVMKLAKNILFIPEKRKLLIQKKKSYSIAMRWPKIMNTST